MLYLKYGPHGAPTYEKIQCIPPGLFPDTAGRACPQRWRDHCDLARRKNGGLMFKDLDQVDQVGLKMHSTSEVNPKCVIVDASRAWAYGVHRHHHFIDVAHG